MNLYNIKGNKIKPQTRMYKKFIILLYNDFYVHVYDYDLIELVDKVTEGKHIFLFDEYGLETIVFRKHIVKITEVK